MKKLLVLAAIIGMFGCNRLSEKEKMERTLSSLKAPVIVIGVDSISHFSFTVVDSNKVVKGFTASQYPDEVTKFVQSIASSRSIGDTLIK